MARMTNWLYRTVVRVYMRFESRTVSAWHPDYQRAFFRSMYGIKRRIFPRHGEAALLGRLERQDALTASPVEIAEAPCIPPTVDTPAVEACIAVEAAVLEVPEPASPVEIEAPAEIAAPAEVVVPAQVEAPAEIPTPESVRCTEETEFATWLWLEQENMKLVARHLGLAAFDWNGLPLRRAGDSSQDIVPAVRDLLVRLKEEGVECVMILPWLKHGGADKAAIAYLRTLGARMPGRVLAITTEAADSPWLSRLPAGVSVLEWARVCDWPYAAVAADNLSWLLSRLRPRVIHVMNSWLGWELLLRDGMRLRAVSRIFVSLFWYGPSDHGNLRGYAPEYLPKVIGNVDGVITDNKVFPIVLNRDYGFPLDIFHCVWHPTDHIADRPLPVCQHVLTFLWASRFAPEKRLDILAAIASSRPKYRFVVFGALDGEMPMLADSLQILAGLPNVTMGGAFDGFESLPIDECDAFLYTSSSDGMPNVVIEALAHGLPLVAPLVGGVGDLLDADTGWVVSQFDSVSSYLAAIDDLAAHEALRPVRAANALARLRERHESSAFEKALLAVPGYVSGQ